VSLDVDLRGTFTARGADPFAVEAAFSVAAGETLVVLGPSGSGKSLLLESIAGVRAADGRVAVDGNDVSDAPPEDRNVGFVFQDYALFPHLTVRENAAYGTRYHDDTRDPDAVLDALGVADLADRTPPTLSGGERQRVALARALVVRPDAFLLDEPLSALDAPTRASLRGDLADALASETAVYVTHDRTTARALADRVAVLADGRIRQVGDPETVFERPDSPFVARFTGANCLPRETLPAAVRDSLPAGPHVAIRPEHVVLGADDPDTTATVVRSVREDAAHRVTLALGDERVDVFTDQPPRGEQVEVSFPREHCHVIAE
jgi:ABC-type sugar transport system ATPase subunit